MISSLSHAIHPLVSVLCLPSCDGNCTGLSNYHCQAVCCSPLAEVLCGGLPPSYSSAILWCHIGYADSIGRGIYLFDESLCFSVSMPWSYGSGHSACHRFSVGSFCVGIGVLAEPHRSICKSLGLSPHSPLFCSISFLYSSSHLWFNGHRLQVSYFMHSSISLIALLQTAWCNR